MKTLGHPIIIGLPDLAADLLSFAGQLRSSGEPADAETFRIQINGLLSELEARAREEGFDSSDTSLVKYALVALIDETILTSKWALKDAWMGNPLQMEHFNEFAAGEEFYTKLEQFRGSTDPAKLGVLEVYYLAMALGFRGKYGDFQGLEKQKVLMQEVATRIRESRPGGLKALSPAWEQEQGVGQLAKEFPVWIISVACGAVVLVLYIVLSAILGGMAGGIAEKVG